jgi:hypothetical protein
MATVMAFGAGKEVAMSITPPPIAERHLMEAFQPGKVWLDDRGKPIESHLGGLYYEDGVYYWYGMNFDGETVKPFTYPNQKFSWMINQGTTCYSSDLKGVTGEAPAVFKHDGIYYFLTSHLTGWGPNPNKYAVAVAFLGPYETKGPFCTGPGAANSFGSQTTFVLPVAGKPGQFIWMADRVNAKSQTEIDDMRQATHIWLPIILDPAQKRLRVEWRDQWDLSVFDQPWSRP